MRLKSIAQKYFLNSKTQLIRFWKNVPKEIYFILILFLTSKVFLTFCGLSSRIMMNDTYNSWYEWRYDKRQWLDIWSAWDSGWYLDIAQNGYSSGLVSDLPKKTCCDQSNIGFFPLYPLLIRLASNLEGNFHTAGIIISNSTLILSGIVLYMLIALDSSKNTARRSVLYMFLFPTAFILSSVMSESLFLFLSILCFYFARKERWFLSGISGFLLSLTRPTGILCLLPIAIFYLKSKKFKIDKDLLFLLLYPLGLFIFSTYLYFLTGDFLAYFHSKTNSWGTTVVNPFSLLLNFLISSPETAIISVFTMIEIVLSFYLLKKGYFEYAIYSFIMIVFTLINGPETAIGIPRMSSAIFPFFFSMALITGKGTKVLIPIFLIILQALFMMLWSVGVFIL